VKDKRLGHHDMRGKRKGRIVGQSMPPSRNFEKKNEREKARCWLRDNVERQQRWRRSRGEWRP